MNYFGNEKEIPYEHYLSYFGDQEELEMYKEYLDGSGEFRMEREV